MCMHCVDIGKMTLAEYDKAILAGDTTVMPLMDLEPEAVENLVVGLMGESIRKGMDIERALDIGIGTIAAYYEVTGRRPA